MPWGLALSAAFSNVQTNHVEYLGLVLCTAQDKVFLPPYKLLKLPVSDACSPVQVLSDSLIFVRVLGLMVASFKAVSFVPLQTSAIQQSVVEQVDADRTDQFNHQRPGCPWPGGAGNQLSGVRVGG